ncbi:protein Son isoform X2 [Zophobas morio]|uniref:protein Son isoform X2 n=1 Tax=Zophobas morio TaxID=2755281 RepID=UPI003083C716
MPSEEQKPVVDTPVKSSMEILSELFNSFDAEPPLIIKKEKSDSPKKSKKSKKKHKHKEKKHKKKEKKKKRENSVSSERSEIDLAEILIKQEKESSEKKIKIEGTDISFNLASIKKEGEEKSDKEKSEKKDRTKDGLEKNLEEGEVDSGDDKKHKKRKHKADHDKNKKKKKEERSKQSEERELQLKINDLRNKIKGNQRSRSVERRSRSREKRSRSRDKRSRSRDEDFYRKSDKSREPRARDRDKYKDYDHKSKRKDNSFYKDEDIWRHRSHHERERRHRDRSSSRDSSHIDKKKLLEIARKNAIQMMKSGSLPGALTLGPQAQEKVIAAIRAGGKTIEELTDFCKTLSKKEELGELSSNTENGSDSDTDKPFHHPFQIKDRPTSITMNIKNSVPLPIKSTQERTSELRLQFPVSSGQLHRKSENEWVPVSPKKPPEPVPPPKVAETPAAPEPVPPVVPVAPSAPPGPQIFPQPIEASVDIGSIVSQRLTAIRKLQENPNDVQALTQMYKSNQEMQSWAQSKQQPGQFTGTTGAQVLSQAELSSGYQAWAKKASVRLLNQGSSRGNWLTSGTNTCGPTHRCYPRLGRDGHASAPEDGVEAGRRAGQGENGSAGAAAAGG